MLNRWNCLVVSTAVVVFCLVSAQQLTARDVFLTIGGGYSPTGNQISLEKNVQLFSSFLDETYQGNAEHYIYFADGKNQLRDLQFMDPEFPKVNELLAVINNQSSNLKYQYRNHEIEDVTGPSNVQQLNDWFSKQGSGLKAGDRLVIYVTAHGGKAADRKDPENTKLHLWNGQHVDVKQFHGWMEKIDPEVPIIVVMVQCYSGGFSNLIFTPDEEDNCLVERPWCGFFATVHNRVAAGCTADTRVENYHEYSTYFMEALRGQTRTGESVERPDFDENGMISLDEAHAYVLINSKTIDISLKTSDQYLRKIDLKASEDEAELEADSPYDELLKYASINQTAVLEKLSEELGLDGQKRATAAKALATRVNNEKKEAEKKRRSMTRDWQRTAGSLKGAVRMRWPELTNAWNPAAQQLIEEEGESILKAIESHGNFGKFKQLSQQMSELRTKAMDADRRWVKCQRLIRTLESVALAANLDRFGTLEQKETFERLQQLETSNLGLASEESSQAGAP